MNEKYRSKLYSQHETLSNSQYVFKPMVVPPKPWTSTTDGGYWTIKNKLFNMKDSAQQKIIAKEWENSDIDGFLAAINIVQNVPWRINKRVLEVYSKLVGTGLAGLPDEAQIYERVPKKPWNTTDEYKKLKAEDETKITEYYKAKDYIIRNRQKAADCKARNDMAQKYKDEEKIWFPHYCDFRGRIYPFPRFIHPEVSEDGKALIEFAEGKPLGNSGDNWLMINLANMAGKDKRSFQGRKDWVVENEEHILASANDPIEYNWWMDTEQIDKPFQFLAACFAYSEWKEQGDEYLCHLPIAQDGSNNGIQHLSAMSLDDDTAKLVNLLSADKPDDMYRVIADDVAKRVEEEANEGIEEAIAWRGKVNRKIVKKPAMTFSYGSTFHGINNQIAEILIELNEKSEEPYITISNWKAASYLAKHVWEALEDNASGPFEVMKWTKKIAKICSKENKPIKWTSAIGLPITQAYYKPRISPKIVNTFWGKFKRRIRLTLQRNSDTIDSNKMQASIAPNFVHSMDASHLLMTVLLTKRMGYDHFACVHDSIATHACDVRALRLYIWFIFKKIYSVDRLEKLRQEIQEQVETEIPKFDHYKGLELDNLPAYFFS